MKQCVNYKTKTTKKLRKQNMEKQIIIKSTQPPYTQELRNIFNQ